jgi:mRNA-degrading endonuclease RelE of RelBE toxin-antitoxin system
MAAVVWRVEFDRAAARELRKLGAEAERRVLGFLRTRIAGSSDTPAVKRLGANLSTGRGGKISFPSIY